MKEEINHQHEGIKILNIDRSIRRSQTKLNLHLLILENLIFQRKSKVFVNNGAIINQQRSCLVFAGIVRYIHPYLYF